MSSTALGPLAFSGGDASAQFDTFASNVQTLNLNPLFAAGGGNPVNSPSGAATASDSATATPLLSPSPAGAGLATLNTAYPGSATAASSSSSLLIWLVIGGAVLLLMMPEGRHR